MSSDKNGLRTREEDAELTSHSHVAADFRHARRRGEVIREWPRVGHRAIEALRHLVGPSVDAHRFLDRGQLLWARAPSQPDTVPILGCGARFSPCIPKRRIQSGDKANGTPFQPNRETSSRPHRVDPARLYAKLHRRLCAVRRPIAQK